MDNQECFDNADFPIESFKSSCTKFDKKLMILMLPYTKKYQVLRFENSVYFIQNQIATHHTIAKKIDLWKAYWFAFKRSKKRILNILYDELKKRNDF
jgi:hypothetical protein